MNRPRGRSCPRCGAEECPAAQDWHAYCASDDTRDALDKACDDRDADEDRDVILTAEQLRTLHRSLRR